MQTSVEQAFYCRCSSLKAANHRLFNNKCGDLLVWRSATGVWKFAPSEIGITSPRG